MSSKWPAFLECVKQGWEAASTQVLLSIIATVAPFAIYGVAVWFIFAPLAPAPEAMGATIGKPPAFLTPLPAEKTPETPPRSSVEDGVNLDIGKQQLATSGKPASGVAAEKAPAAPKVTGGAILAADIAARANWMLASLGLIAAAVVSILLGYMVSISAAGEIVRQQPSEVDRATPIAAPGKVQSGNLHRWLIAIPFALALAVGIFGFGEGKGGREADPLRQIVADCKFENFDPKDNIGRCLLNHRAHESAAVKVFGNDDLKNVQDRVQWNSVIGTAAAGFLAGCFGLLAWPIAEPKARSLRRRRRDYILLLGSGALLLSFSVAATHAYYHWGAALVEKSDAEYLTSLATTVSVQWGFLYTAILVATAGATALSLRMTIDKLGEDTTSEGGSGALEKWLKEEGLEFTPVACLKAFLLTMSPVLTAPALELLKAGLS